MDIALTNSLSGLLAAQKRIEVAASNIANAGSDGPLPDAVAASDDSVPKAYQPLRVDQQPLLSGGTIAQTALVDPATQVSYSPDSPYANAQGEVAVPNVDLTTEIVNTIVAKNAYVANLRVAQVASEIDRDATHLGETRSDLTA